MSRRSRSAPVEREPVPMHVDALDHDGQGVSRREGKVVFVRGGMPDEDVLATVVRSKPRFDVAEVHTILRESSQRVEARCPHFGVCGGCSMQHVGARAQVAFKQRVLEDSLKHIADVRPEHMLAPIEGAAWGYRFRARLTVRHVPKKGGVLVGFHERGSSYVADMRECHVLPPRVSDMLVPLRGLVESLSIRERLPQVEVAIGDALPAAIEKAEQQQMLHALIDEELKANDVPDAQAGVVASAAAGVAGSSRRALDTVQRTQARHDAARLHIALVFRVLEPPTEDDLDKLLRFARAWEVDAWLQPKGPDSILPIGDVNRARALSYALPEFGIRMPFAPTEFTQVNTGINRRMVLRAVDLLGVQAQDRVVDLFCGIGNFTLPLATRAARVTGIEGADALVRRARENLDANGDALRAAHGGRMPEVDFEVANLFEFDAAAWDRLGHVDRVLIDPPRDGALAVCQVLAATPRKPDRVVYVSCNPATLARDAAVLVHQGGWRLVSAGVMNMFPHTSHVESMAVFEPGDESIAPAADVDVDAKS